MRTAIKLIKMRPTAPTHYPQKGFTLVESAIVLVLIGLLIGGILRGQELIASARVRNVIDQVRAVQVAYYGFQDRYSALAGDLTAAQAALINANAAPALLVAGDGWVPIGDSQQFFNNISQAGFLSCSQCMTKQTSSSNPTANFSPTNLFGQPLGFAFPSNVPTTNALGTYYLSTQANEGSKAMVTTGGAIDSKALAEIDRKIDDGNPTFGQFRFSDQIPTINGTLVSPPFANCVDSDAISAYVWKVDGPGQCQGVLLL
jgi:prepilin-type N-terminal cleavage/methylation domain-containing protein